LLGFFEKAKKYTPSIMSIITPSAASSTSMPTSSTPAASALMPPPSAGATSSAPSQRSLYIGGQVSRNRRGPIHITTSVYDMNTYFD
jgi:hypothetical protein